MPLPPEVDTRIRKRFSELLSEAERLHKILWSNVDRFGGDYYSDENRLRVNVISLLQLLKGSGDHIQIFVDNINELYTARKPLATDIKGVLDGLKSDYEAGMLESLADAIETHLSTNYLGQAEELLVEGQTGKFDHVPAAVLTGAILENALRKLCDRQIPPISLLKSNGEPKTLNILIDDLKKANLYNELKAKQLRSWADIRNTAAHGEFDKFKRTDVEQMIAGVRNFLADFL